MQVLRNGTAVSIVIAVAAVLLFALPGAADLRELLIYNRTAVLEGEYWRLLSGHLVHFSPQHLLSDALVFVLLAAVLERQVGGARLLGLLALLALGCSLLLMAAVPAMAFYGGLSALNYGLLATLASRLRHCGLPNWLPTARHGIQAWLRQLPLVLLPLLLLHALWQGLSGTSLLSATDDGVVPAWQAHGAAVVLALILLPLSGGLGIACDAARKTPVLPRGALPVPR